MPLTPKPDPIQHCAFCGKHLHRKRWKSGTLEDMTAFKKRRYCNQHCMAKGQEGVIKKPNAKNSRRQSGKMVGKSCLRCGKTRCKLHVHHKDENPLNNAPENLETLCVSCHKASHSPNYMGMPLQRKPCLHCSKPVARQGFCNTHLSRKKRFGDPLLKKFKTASGWVLRKVDS